MVEYETLGTDEESKIKITESFVKTRLEILRDLGFRITTPSIFLGDFVVGILSGGLQVAPEIETEQIDVRYQTNRVKPVYVGHFETATFGSPYSHTMPCRYVLAELKLTTDERWEEVKREEKIFPKGGDFNYYIYPRFKDFQLRPNAINKAYLAPRDLLESAGILEESGI
jgi:hypothetical protein